MSDVTKDLLGAQTTVDAQTVDRAWARFCGAFGDGPDAPYPGMIAAFETHYGQSFRDKEWRTEAACWAAAWSKATARAEAALAEHQPDAGLIARDDVNRMARESGLLDWALHDRDEKILRFAHLVIADFLQRTGQYVTNDASREAALEQAKAEERKACIAITKEAVEGATINKYTTSLEVLVTHKIATHLIDAIRARGKK